MIGSQADLPLDSAQRGDLFPHHACELSEILGQRFGKRVIEICGRFPLNGLENVQ
jgi:hypothetical protein